MFQFDELSQKVVSCQNCPRLRSYCERVAQEKRRSYRNESYWGKPVPGWGDTEASLIVVGLAPGAHGSNRTGRMFTGDRSGDFLYRALYTAGFCNQPQSISLNDGLSLQDVYITAVGRCAPPKNKPTVSELENCRTYLIEEFRLLSRARVILALGKIAFEGILKSNISDFQGVRPLPIFGHGRVYPIGKYILVASYHVSQQNTQTGRLTVSMFDGILSLCKQFMLENGMH